MQTSSPPNRTQSADNLHGPHNHFSGILSHDGIEQSAGANDAPTSSTGPSTESFVPHTMSTSFLDSNNMEQEHNSASISDGPLLRWVPRDNPPVIQGVYAPPSLPVSDDFIDLDVYPGSANTSDEEQDAPQNAIDSFSSYQDNSRENANMDLHFQSPPFHLDPVAVASGSLYPAREPSPLVPTSNRGHNENRLGQWNSFGQPSDPWGLYTGEIVSSSPPSMLCLRRTNPQQDIGPPSTAGANPVVTRQMTGRICASSPALEPAPASFDMESSLAPSTSFGPPSPPQPSLSDGLGREARRPPSPLPQPLEGSGVRQQPAFSDVGCMDVQLMPLSDVASGSSITCTLVNLLRGLSLIDRYSLEDLCDYLPARKHRCPPRRRQQPQQYKPPVSGDDDECSPEIHLTSPPPSPPPPPSCSASSLSLHKRTVCAAVRKKSTSLPSRIPAHTTTGKAEGGGSSGGGGGGCLVNYLLTCSRLGSNAISDFLPTDSDPCLYCSSSGSTNGAVGGSGGVLDGKVRTSNCYQGILCCPACLAATAEDEVESPPCHLLASDWRRGRSDGLVCVVAGCDAAVCVGGATAAVGGGSHLSPSLSSSDLLAGGGGCVCGPAACASRPPKPRLSCLIAGRFLPGEESWRGLWPKTASAGFGTTAEADLVTWIAAWIQAGGVLFFAQLDDTSSSASGGGGGNNFLQNANYELCWRHRLVVGVSGGRHIHLSNPLEVVSAAWVLSYLAKLTKLSVHKSDVMQLWSLGASSALSPQTAAGDYVLRGGVGGLFPATTDGASSFSPNLGQDLSLLSQQRDIRWSRFNILGQVISTLRDYDSFMERQELDKPPEASLFWLPTAHHRHHHPGFSHPLDSLRSSLLMNAPRQSQSVTFSTSASGPHNGGGGSSGSTNGLPQECLSSDPNLVIPCAQRPGFSIFVLRKNKELLRTLLSV